MNKNGKFVTFGEIMLRLRSPEHYRLFQTPELEATFGGGEANVAVSLSILGRDACFVTSLPNNAVGEACKNEVIKYGVDTSKINMTEGRLGIYYLESGANQRPSLVVYDRAESCIAKAPADAYDWKGIFADASWFHISGITPAVSQNAADASLAAMKAAKANGVTVSIDLNFRKKLWKYGKDAPEVMRELTKYVDVVIANEEDIQKCLGISMADAGAKENDVTKAEIDADAYEKLTAEVKKQFPNVQIVAVTLRESISADHNGWSACISGTTGFYVSRHYDITDIIDRVGGGDSFSAGLIFGLSEYGTDEESAINFAAASSCLKHSISGDFNLSRKSEVLSLMGGDGSGRVQR